jgi:mono/diheme cytochrome c family protein
MSSVLVAVFGFYLTPDSMADDHHQMWVADAEASSVENPVNASLRSANRGARLYTQRCTVCHGEEGAGDGPGGRALSPKPANLTVSAVQDQSDGSLFWKIAEGRGAMPAWKSILDEDQRWNLVNFIKSLNTH